MTDPKTGEVYTLFQVEMRHKIKSLENSVSKNDSNLVKIFNSLPKSHKCLLATSSKIQLLIFDNILEKTSLKLSKEYLSYIEKHKDDDENIKYVHSVYSAVLSILQNLSTSNLDMQNKIPDIDEDILHMQENILIKEENRKNHPDDCTCSECTIKRKNSKK